MHHTTAFASSPARRARSRAHLAAWTGVFALVSLLVTGPVPALACACGCGVFEVGTASMFPTQTGGTFSLEYDFMNQDRNWSGSASAPASENADRRIRTAFVTAGAQYMLTRSWGVGVEVPYWNRRFGTADDAGDVVDFTHGAVGDARVRGTWAGFSEDLSTGITAGLKLPTGDHTYANFDRDTEIGTGSTDLLLGAYHVGPLTADRRWTWFIDGLWARPFVYSGGYRPGSEADLTAALSHAGHRFADATVAPLLELTWAARSHDRGTDANPGDSGYERLLAAPGIDALISRVRATITVAVPVHEHVHGNQLVAPALFKLVVGHPF